MFGRFIKRWVNGVRPVTGVYVCLTLKILENFQGPEKVGNNEVGQNEFIPLKFGVQ